MSSSTTFGTGQEATDALKAQITGKNVVITGVTPGSLGEEVVRLIAPYAANILIATRRPAKSQEVVASFGGSSKAKFEHVELDLTSPKSIEAAGQRINGFKLPIHVVFNNAAVPVNPELKRTDQGLEAQLGGDHLGHFLFTGTILPSLLLASKNSSGDAPRVITVSSLASLYSDLRWDDVFYEKRPEEYKKWTAYAEAKTANILFTRELASRFKSAGVLAFALHPGIINSTAIGSLSPEDYLALGLKNPDGTQTDLAKSGTRTVGQAATSYIVGGFDPSIKDQSGGLLVDGAIHNELIAPHITEDKSAKLWELSESLTGVKFSA